MFLKCIQGLFLCSAGVAAHFQVLSAEECFERAAAIDEVLIGGVQHTFPRALFRGACVGAGQGPYSAPVGHKALDAFTRQFPSLHPSAPLTSSPAPDSRPFSPPRWPALSHSPKRYISLQPIPIPSPLNNCLFSPPLAV